MKSFERLQQKYNQFSDEHPYAATMAETAILFGVRDAMQRVGDKVGVPIGHGRKNNPSRNNFIEKHPILAATSATLYSPVTEELFFRELPNRLLENRGYDNNHPASKVAIAAIFAAIHAGPDAIPVPQFIGGLNYNRIHKERGLWASILAHSTNNVLYVAQQCYRKNKKPN